VEQIVEIPWHVLMESVPTYKNCGEFAEKNGLSIRKIKYLNAQPILECSIVDEKVYMLMRVKYGI
jgi:hypothetical protein